MNGDSGGKLTDAVRSAVDLHPPLHPAADAVPCSAPVESQRQTKNLRNAYNR